MLNDIDSGYFNISKAFVNTNTLSKSTFLNQVFDTAFELIPEAQRGSFFELKEGFFQPIVARGYDFEVFKDLKFAKDDLLSEFTLSKCDNIEVKQVMINTRQETFSQEHIKLFKRLHSFVNLRSLYTLIRYDGNIIGILSLENFDDVKFSKNSEAVLKIYGQAISNNYAIKLNYEKEKDKHLETINAMMSIIEVKDPYTIGHAKRVMRLSTDLARFMTLDYQDVERIKIASILHDIGKIGIPDDILNKPAGLTAIEYEVVKSHPDIGLKILSKISDFNDITELMYHHHEHYDGTGYPKGLKGDDIPFCAQIIQIVDAYDAMTSERAYRKPFDQNKALSIIQSQRGKQFHPLITDEFVKMMKEK